VILVKVVNGISVDHLFHVSDAIKNYSENGTTTDVVMFFVKGKVNETILTGLAIPFTKNIESKVFGATTFIYENIIVKVFKTAENSSIRSFKVESFMEKSYLFH
jgi:cation transport ATPase